MPTKPSTKSEIYTYISERTNLKKKEVGAVFDALANMISRDLKRGVGVFNVPGLMKIKAVHKPAVPERRGINPSLKGLKDMV
jgi:nucleoid DNA-binding protein